MKFKSWLLAIFYYSIQFAAGPFILNKLNKYLDLPVFSGIFMKLAGAFFLLLGIAIIAYCFYLLRIFGSGTPAPIQPPRKIVFKSIYKHSRNPMYIGYMSVLLGEFFIAGSFLLFFYFLASILGFNLLVILWEERILQKRFNIEYTEYRKKVPRWF